MLVKLFEEKVKKTPEKVIVKTNNRELTYCELNNYANAIADEINKETDCTVQGEDKAALLFEHGTDMIAGTLGALKANKVYIPCDPSYPENRLLYMLKNSEAELIITNNANIKLAKRLKNQADKYMRIINIDEINTNNAVPNPERRADKDKIAYILYTSGSTGNPKGIVQTHGNVLHFINCYIKNLNITEADRMTLFSSFSHDAAIMDIYSSLLSGAALHPLNIKEQANMTVLAEWLYNEKITIWHSVPTLYRYFINTLTDKAELNNIRLIVLGGESVIEHDITSFKKHFDNAVLVNLYGQSESSYNSALFVTRDTKLKMITLGEAVDETEILVINDDGEEVAPLNTGEIVIASKYIAKGYWKDEEKTKYSFSHDPDLGNLYWTGDLGRVTEDGNIEFLGRKDYQIKIRGHRVELGEIETKILSYSRFKEAVVIGKEDKLGEKYLCAYIAADESLADEEALITAELREYLAKDLPEYMIPSYFVYLDKLPQTPNGKLDRTALVSISTNQEAAATTTIKAKYEAPRTELEEMLVKLWKETLGAENIGINDNFFELGGHSLKAANLITKIHRELNIEVPLKEIFEAPTIKGISEYINTRKESIYASIQPVKRSGHCPASCYIASSAQKRIYALQQIELKNTSYNMPAVFEIEGELDIQRLKQAINRLIEKHEALRTSFELYEDSLMQKIHKQAGLNIELLDSTLSVEQMTKQFVRAFNLNESPLLRVGLAKVNSDSQINTLKYILLFDMHHIISDGTSIGILIEEFGKAYAGKELPELKIQYKDFAEWQNQLFKSEKIKNQEKYWIESLSNELPVLNLPYDYTRPLVQSFEGSKISFEINADITAELRKLAKETNTTMYMILLAVYNVLLHKYSGQEDIIVGSPIAGRPRAELSNIIGMFVNTLAMRCFPKGQKTFRKFLLEVKETALKAYENQDYQFEELVDQLEVKRDMSRNPIFDVVFVLQNMDLKQTQLEGITIKPRMIDSGISKFDMTLTAMEEAEKINITIEYCTKLFKKETIERLCNHLLSIIQEAAQNTDKTLAAMQMLTSLEKQQLLAEFNNTKMEYPQNKTIQQMFEEQAEQTPDNTALVYGSNNLTYKELNQKANQLARVLRDKGLKPDSIAGILIEPSLEMIVGILGVIKAGGAYLPIDPSYPQQRICYMIEDSKAEILLTQSTLSNLSLLHETSVNTINLDDKSLYCGNCQNLESINTSYHMAYVIYTSGSTGKPKGVMIEHDALINMCTWYNHYYSLNENDRGTKYAGFGFDASVWEIFPYLLTGASIYIIEDEIKLNIDKLNEYYEHKKITISFLPTQICEQFILKDNKNLRCLLTGGDKLKQYKKTRYKLVNNYGPTENTVAATSFVLDKEYNNIPIGKPIANTQIYIIDKFNSLQPIGVAGELCISGASLSRGYLNNPELTAEKFAENPFVNQKGSRMYRTGDIARWLPDGNIEFLDRIDEQVKIRGYRIELGEIENSLLRHEAVNEAAIAVMAEENEADGKYLCGYFTAARELSISELREHLSKELPDYMIPYSFIQLDSMPLTPNGKLDRKALSDISRYADSYQMLAKTDYEAPRNDAEEKLAYIWMEVLGTDKVGISDSFFMLGGDSIKAIQVCARLQRYNMKLEVKHLLQNSTIKEASKYLERLNAICGTDKQKLPTLKGTMQSRIDKEEYELIKAILKENGIEQSNIEDMYPLSPMQEGMLFHTQLKNNKNVYFEQTTLDIAGEISIDIFEESFNKVIEKYDVLRTVFIHERVRKPVQVVLKEARRTVEFINIAELSETNKEKYIEEFKVKDREKGFDLTRELPVRAYVIKLEQQRYTIIWSFHHIVMDGWCLSLIMKDFIKGYISKKEGNQIQIGTGKSYSEYIEWLEKKDKEEAISYWKNHLDGYEQKAAVPTTKFIVNRDECQNRERIMTLNKETTRALVRLSQQYGVTLNTVMQGIWGVILQGCNNTDDVVFGTVVSGRPAEITGIEEMVGLFINTIPVRFKTKQEEKYEKTFEQAVKELQKQAIGAAQYEYIALAEIQTNSELKQNLIDNLFVFENYPTEKEIETSFSINNLGFKVNTAKSTGHTSYNFNFVVMPGEELLIKLGYNEKIYDEEQIERILGNIHKVIDTIIESPSIKLKDVEILASKEKQQLLIDFNDTAAEYPENKTICQLFEEQAEKTPYNIAIVFDSEASVRKTLTYKELNERANQLAEVLRSKTIQADDKTSNIIAIMVEGSLEMIVGIMGILKSGAAYLPIDPRYPKDRIEYMLEDSGVGILLTQTFLKDKLEYDKSILLLDDEDLYKGNTDECTHISKIKGITMWDTDNLLELAYVIYTSGSMGTPKGVMIGHRSLVNMCTWYKKYYDLNETSRCTKYAGFGFDASVWEIFPALITGASLYIVNDDIKLDIEKLNEYYELNHITHSFLPTQVCEEFMIKDNKSLKYLATGGDKLKQYFDTRYTLINNYGPTENTVVATSFILDMRYDNIPIGKPISNTKIYIVDRYNKLVPIGVPGELCISGASLAIGYLNRPELTAEKFVVNPFGTDEYRLMYRTGDLARWLPDGNIEFLGRIDQQVKIRGYRIELGEIESQLLGYPGIKAAAVAAKEDNCSKYLCAYIAADRDFTAAELKAFLSEKLPSYMIPRSFIKLEALPLTANGKVDKKALLDLEVQKQSEVEGIDPRNEIEKFLTSEISKVMSLDNIGINENLFDKGATSLDIMKITQRIKDKYVIDYNQVFQFPYISEIAKRVKAKQYDTITHINKLKEKYRDPDIENYMKNQVEEELKEYLNRSTEECDKLDLSKTKNYENILLAGAAGYLGIYLLKDILENTGSSLTVIIRGKTLEEAKNRLMHKLKFYFDKDIYNRYENRLNILNGDLSETMLGLSSSQYTALISSVDCVINSAANVRHFGLYEEFHKSNVRVTQNLLDICGKTDKKDYFHVSTLSIGSGYIENKEVQFFSEYECDLGQTTDNYYVSTKLEAEKLALEARTKGINTTIFRMGNLVFDSETGRAQENIQDNAFYQIARSLIKFRFMPNETNKYAEFTFIDMASKAVILLFNKAALENQVFHINNINLVRYDEFLELTSDIGVKLELVEIDDFLDALIKSYDNPVYKHHIDTMLIHTEMLNESKYTSFVKASYKTNIILNKLGFKWDKITKYHMKNMFDYGFKIGYFE